MKFLLLECKECCNNHQAWPVNREGEANRALYALTREETEACSMEVEVTFSSLQLFPYLSLLPTLEALGERIGGCMFVTLTPPRGKE